MKVIKLPLRQIKPKDDTPKLPSIGLRDVTFSFINNFLLELKSTLSKYHSVAEISGRKELSTFFSKKSNDASGYYLLLKSMRYLGMAELNHKLVSTFEGGGANFISIADKLAVVYEMQKNYVSPKMNVRKALEMATDYSLCMPSDIKDEVPKFAEIERLIKIYLSMENTFNLVMPTLPTLNCDEMKKDKCASRGERSLIGIEESINKEEKSMIEMVPNLENSLGGEQQGDCLQRGLTSGHSNEYLIHRLNEKRQNSHLTNTRRCSLIADIYSYVNKKINKTNQMEYSIHNGILTLSSNMFTFELALCGSIQEPKWQLVKASSHMTLMNSQLLLDMPPSIPYLTEFSQFYENAYLARQLYNKLKNISVIDLNVSGTYKDFMVEFYEFKLYVKRNKTLIFKMDILPTNTHSCFNNQSLSLKENSIEQNDINTMCRSKVKNGKEIDANITENNHMEYSCLSYNVLTQYENYIRLFIESLHSKAEFSFDEGLILEYQRFKSIEEFIAYLKSKEVGEKFYNYFTQNYCCYKNFNYDNFGDRNVLLVDARSFICIRLLGFKEESISVRCFIGNLGPIDILGLKELELAINTFPDRKQEECENDSYLVDNLKEFMLHQNEEPTDNEAFITAGLERNNIDGSSNQMRELVQCSSSDNLLFRRTNEMDNLNESIKDVEQDSRSLRTDTRRSNNSQPTHREKPQALKQITAVINNGVALECHLQDLYDFIHINSQLLFIAPCIAMYVKIIRIGCSSVKFEVSKAVYILRCTRNGFYVEKLDSEHVPQLLERHHLKTRKELEAFLRFKQFIEELNCDSHLKSLVRQKGDFYNFFVSLDKILVVVQKGKVSLIAESFEISNDLDLKNTVLNETFCNLYNKEISVHLIKLIGAFRGFYYKQILPLLLTTTVMNISESLTLKPVGADKYVVNKNGVTSKYLRTYFNSFGEYSTPIHFSDDKAVEVILQIFCIEKMRG